MRPGGGGRRQEYSEGREKSITIKKRSRYQKFHVIVTVQQLAKICSGTSLKGNS